MNIPLHDSKDLQKLVNTKEDLLKMPQAFIIQ